jgi:hypothetical protein
VTALECVLTLLQFVTRCRWSYDWCSDCGACIREDDCHACEKYLDFGEDET